MGKEEILLITCLMQILETLIPISIISQFLIKDSTADSLMMSMMTLQTEEFQETLQQERPQKIPQQMLRGPIMSQKEMYQDQLSFHMKTKKTLTQDSFKIQLNQNQLQNSIQ